MRKKTSKASKIRAYLTANPTAVPKDVGAKFKVAMPMVYAIRKQVNDQITDAVTQVPALSKAKLKPMSTNDLMQVGGDHYKSMSVQPWVAMQSWMSDEQFIGFLQGNAIKYLARYNAKGGVEDVKKARHYIDKMIEVMGD
jgi:hypothetical protein